MGSPVGSPGMTESAGAAAGFGCLGALGFLGLAAVAGKLPTRTCDWPRSKIALSRCLHGAGSLSKHMQRNLSSAVFFHDQHTTLNPDPRSKSPLNVSASLGACPSF
jgi:hypothetical protein